LAISPLVNHNFAGIFKVKTRTTKVEWKKKVVRLYINKSPTWCKLCSL